jgi:hypothetical protein
MPDRSPQPSLIFFPSALHPQQADEEQEHVLPATVKEPWGWLEFFLLAQVLWGALLFLPGSQAYRGYIRGVPYVMSLVALIVCARSSGTDTAAPGARWLLAIFMIMIVSLVRPETWFMSGIAQIFFQVSIVAPLFWAARMDMNEARLQRLLFLIFAANFASAGLGLLQVFYPATFLPPEFSSLSAKLNPDFLQGLSYVGADGRKIVRPPGLSDLPGGAAIAGATAVCLAFGFAVRPVQRHVIRAFYIVCTFAAFAVIYLTQVRSLLIMAIGAMLAMAVLRLRQGRLVQSGWMAAIIGGIVVAAFTWAVSVGGDVVYERFFGITETGVMQTFQKNRGFFLEYTLRELLWEHPFGAGLGRWGMMTVYFGEPSNWQYPALHAEIQVTGWLYDGGVLLMFCYSTAILIALRQSYRLAVHTTGTLCDCASMVFAFQLFVAGLCFTGPVFNTQFGIVFWLATAVLHGAMRTMQDDVTNAELEDEELLAAEAAGGSPA